MLQELHTFIRNIIRKKRSGFIPAPQITDVINRASYDLWREMVEKERETGVPSSLLIPFHFSDSDTSASGTDSVYTYELAQFSNTTDEYEVLSGHVGDKPMQIFLGERTWGQRFFMPTPEEYVHYRTLRQNISLAFSDSGKKDLPAYFKKDLGVIYYKDAQNNLFEGEILPHDKFLNRVNSDILAPDTANPIATIDSGQLKIYPTPPSGETYTYEFPYEAYTSIDFPVGRVYANASGVEMVVEPSGTNLGITITGYRPPQTATATYSYASGEITVTTSTDLDWNDNAFSLIARRALTYLGFSLPDDRTVQIEAVTDQGDQNKKV